MIKILTGSDFEIREEEEKIDMCKALEDLKEEGRQEGWQEGRQDGIRKLILKILAKNQFSYEEIADMTEMSVEAVSYTHLEFHGFFHAVKKICCRSGNGTVGQSCQTVFHGNFLAAQFIGAIFHSGCHHRVADQNNTLVTKHFKGSAHKMCIRDRTASELSGSFYFQACSPETWKSRWQFPAEQK